MIYMFFGTVNWLLYLTAYYVAHDAASNLAKTHRVNIDLEHDKHLTASMKKCLLDHNWSYSDCNIQVVSACTKPYDPKADYANGDCVTTATVDGVPCCISETLQIEKPRLEVFGKEIPVSIVFMLIKWMSILLVGWVLRHGFFAAGVGTRDFSKTAYLDILDAVIFSENLNEDLIRGPAYGISRSGRPQMKNAWPYYSLYATFAIAYTTVLFSQMIYTLFAPKENKEESEMSEELEDLEISSPMVRDELQQQTVRINASGPSDGSLFGTSLLSLNSSTRPGQIVGRTAPGMYRVRFSDDLQPSEMLVSVHALMSPDGTITMKGMQKNLKEAAQQGCSGWLRVHELCEGTRSERFEKKAQLLEAFRSLLCLQVPFLLWRLYFDAFFVDMIRFAGRSLLIAKNVIWALYDLVIIAACLNRDATCFGLKPMAVFSMAADTKFGKLWVGPSGIVAMVAEFGGILRKSNLQKHSDRLQKYKEWLRVERELAPGMAEAYDQALQHVQVELAVTEEKLQFTFP